MMNMMKAQSDSMASSSEESQQFSEEDGLRQRPAFYVPSAMEEIDEQERQAFNYLLAVRSQASDIKSVVKAKRKDEKKRIRQQDLLNNPKIEQHFIRDEHIQQISRVNNKTNQASTGIKENTKSSAHEQEILYWVQDWIQETVGNWMCVVSNVQFLQKNHATAHTLHTLTSPALCLASKPLILELFHIGLGAVEDLIASLSQHYYYEGGRYYYLWMYSLLAVHRATATYSIFDALGPLNSCLLSQQKNDPQIYLIACLLKNQFGQRGLQKMLSRAAHFNDK